MSRLIPALLVLLLLLVLPLIFKDRIAERVKACTVCHGKDGRATNEGYFPRIAGKPAGYLYAQLINFRDGRRNNALICQTTRTASSPLSMTTAE